MHVKFGICLDLNQWAVVTSNFPVTATAHCGRPCSPVRLCKICFSLSQGQNNGSITHNNIPAWSVFSKE